LLSTIPFDLLAGLVQVHRSRRRRSALYRQRRTHPLPRDVCVCV
jgi:hypothetical protein